MIKVGKRNESSRLIIIGRVPIKTTITAAIMSSTLFFDVIFIIYKLKAYVELEYL